MGGALGSWEDTLSSRSRPAAPVLTDDALNTSMTWFRMEAVKGLELDARWRRRRRWRRGLCFPQMAFASMLRGRPPHGVRGCAVRLAPFQFEFLSLPSDMHACPSLSDLPAAGALVYPEEHQERILKDCPG